MTRAIASLYWILPVFTLGACVTVPEASAPAGSTTPSAHVTPSYNGAYARPLSDVPPANGLERKARIHTELGMEYLGFGRSDVALDEAKMALKIQSGYAPAHHLIGMIYVELKQYGQAESAFREALSSAPGDPDFNNSFGWFLCQRGRVSEALSHFATAAANPYYNYKTRPYTNAGNCLLGANDVAGAEIQFRNALQVDPGNSEALYRLADVIYRRGNYRGAHDLLVQYHQRFEPGARSVWLGLRAAHRLGERHSEASYMEQLRTRFPASPEYALMMQGKYQ